MTNWKKVFILPALGAVDPLNIHNVLGVRASTVGAWYGGYTSSGDLLNCGNTEVRTLVDTNGPTSALTSIQGADGNRLQAINYVAASTQYHSLAHASWMNIFGTDFSLVIVWQPTTLTNAELFAHYGTNGGFELQGRSDGTILIQQKKSDNTLLQTYTGSGITAGMSYIIHVNRRSSVMTVWLSGVAGTPFSVVDYGADLSASLFIGGGPSGAVANGKITYVRLNNAALTDAQIAKEVSMWQGAGVGAVWAPSIDFARAGTAYQTYGDRTQALRSANMPRVGDGVLIEGACTNLFNSQRDLSGWNFQYGTNTANQGTGPDGTVYLDKLTESVDNGDHLAYQTKTLTAATTYTMECTIQAGGRGYGGFWTSTSGNDYVIWNLSTGAITKQDAEWVTAGSDWLANGNLHIWATIVGDGTANDYGFVPSTDGTTTSYAGDISKGIIIGDMHLRAGAFPTSYTDSTSGTRVADDHSIPTYRLRNTLKDIVTTAPTMWLDFDTTPSGSTITDKSGTYTLTKAGQPKRYTSAVYGDHFLFDGSSDYLYSASTDFNPTGNFSVVAVVIPSTIAAGQAVICSKWNGTGNQRGWMLYRDADSVSFIRSTDGTSGTQLNSTVSAALVANKPSLITATYSTTAGLVLRVDALTPDSDAATGAVYASTANFNIGVEGDLTNKFAGKIPYLAYFNHGAGGTVLSATDHSNMYAALFLPGILPLKMGTGYHYTKMLIECECKFNYSSTTDAGGERRWLDIYGTQGASSVSANRFFFTQASGKFGMNLRDNSGAEQQKLETSARTDLNKWHTVKAYLDFGNTANSILTIDGTNYAASGSWSGAVLMDFTRTHIQMAATAAGSLGPEGLLRNITIKIAND